MIEIGGHGSRAWLVVAVVAATMIINCSEEETSSSSGAGGSTVTTGTAGAGTGGQGTAGTGGEPGPPADPYPYRGLVGLPRDGGEVFLSWRLLDVDQESTGFYVYRRQAEDGEYGPPLNEAAPVLTSTNYVDATAVVSETYFFVVRPVHDGLVGGASNEVQVTAASQGRHDIELAGLGYNQTLNRMGTGDLNGDGLLDYLVRWTDPPEGDDPTVYVDAYVSDDGQVGSYIKAWSFNAGPDDHLPNTNSVQYAHPVTVWDLDGDQRQEVITMRCDGTDAYEIVILDGATGAVLRSLQLPSYDTPRQKLAIAYLRGGDEPYIVAVQGVAHYDKLTRVYAYDKDLQLEWFADQPGDGRGTHRIEVADVDAVDGVSTDDFADEILVGDNLLEGDTGEVRWSLMYDHCDQAMIADIDPNNPGLEAYFAFEEPYGDGFNSPAWLVDAATGATLFQQVRFWDADLAWVGNITDDHPGMELLAAALSMEGDNVDIYDCQGNILQTGEVSPQDTSIGSLESANPPTYSHIGSWRYVKPVRWSGRDTVELMRYDEINVFEWNAGDASENTMVFQQGGHFPYIVGDVLGDYREELITAGWNGNTIRIYTNTTPIERREVTPLLDRKYRQGLSRTAVGYAWLNPLLAGGYPMPEALGLGSIEGEVDADSTGVGQVELTLSGAADKTTTTAPSGSFGFFGLTAGSYTVTPAAAGYSFDPASLSVSLTPSEASLGQDFEANWQLAVTPAPTVATGKSYVFAAVAEGDMHYVDRPYTVVSIPDGLQSHVWLKTAMDDKDHTGDPLVTLTATTATTITVGYAGALPSWLDDGSWQATGDTIEADHSPNGNAAFGLHQKTFPSGEILLGPCAVDAGVMYLILVAS